MKFEIPLRLLVATPLVFALSWASADSWAPPTTETTLSANGRHRVTVVPRPIGGPLAYFEDKVSGKEPAGQRKEDPQKSPLARVEHLGANGKWILAWQGPLVNDVGPPAVLLANDASFLVTFDNWHSAGYGDDVVVIYGARGELVRKLSLDQILPPAYVHHLPRSVSSRWWGSKHRLVEGDRFVELHVVEPGTQIRSEATYVPVRIRLADGSVLPPTGKGWEAANAKANSLEAERLAAWKELRELRERSLPAPISNDTRKWRHYMFEIRDRIAADEESMGGMVLAAPGADPGFHDADDVTQWVEDYDGKQGYLGDSFIFSSPTSDRLADILVKPLRARTAGSMRGAHLVFVGTSAEGRRVANAARSSGAKVTVIDRAKPYPPGKPLPASPPELWMPPPTRF